MKKGNLLVIKMNDGNVMTSYMTPVDMNGTQHWGKGLGHYVRILMKTHHPDKEVVAFALTEAETFSKKVADTGSTIDDCLVVMKKDIPVGNIVAPPCDLGLGEMAAETFVVVIPKGGER